MAKFLYITEADLSVDNGEGVNEREFVRALLVNHADETICVAPAPMYPDNFHDARIVYAPRARRRNPVGYGLHMYGLWRLIRKLEGTNKLAAIIFRLGAIPVVPWLRTLRSGPPVIIKYLGGNPERRTLKLVILSWFRTPMYRSIAQRVAAADTPSVTLAHWASERLRMPPNRLKVIPFGANVDLFYPGDGFEERKRLGLDPAARVIVYVGAMSSIRHVDLLIKAFASLVHNREWSDARLLLVGGGPERHGLEALAAESGVIDRVLFTGPVGYDRVPALLRASDVAVDLSRVPIELGTGRTWASYSQKIAQYLAVGLPVVAWDIPDNRFLAERDIGRLVENEAPATLASVLMSTLEQVDLRAGAWGEAVRRYAVAELSQPELAARRIQMWHRVTEQLR
jgi:glycosyltransferase involved in cell wall biosynthesis